MSQPSFSSFDSALLVRDAQGRYLPATTDQILEAARQAVDQKMSRGTACTSPVVVKEYLTAKLAGLDVEVFAVLFLDSQHRLIEYVARQSCAWAVIGATWCALSAPMAWCGGTEHERRTNARSGCAATV